jgi:hypothetical protein
LIIGEKNLLMSDKLAGRVVAPGGRQHQDR